MYNREVSSFPALVFFFMTELNNSSVVDEVWQQICGYLQPRLSPAVFNTWVLLNPLTKYEIISDTEAVGTISSPTAFHSTNVKKNLQNTLQEAFLHLTGKSVQLQFIVGTPLSKITKNEASSFQKPDLLTPSLSNYQPSTSSSIQSPRIDELFSPATIQSNLISQADFQAKKAVGNEK